MIDLLYLSHTAVPAHLTELEGLGLLEPDEHVLVALDGVLLDSNERRVSGPTLHDYCLLTNMRILLWARDYGRHLCYAFPLTELCLVEGVGLDPLHAHLHLAFAAPGEEEQRFTLTLLPLVDLPAAVTLLRLAGDTAHVLAAQGIEAHEAAPEITALVTEQVYGSPDGQGMSNSPYRWEQTDEQAHSREPSSASPPLKQDPSSLPPEQIYSVSRAGRAAWDTLNRAIRETELPFQLTGSDFRDAADALRALNDLLTTVSGNPGARDVVMAFLRRRSGGDTESSASSASASPSPEDAPSSPSHHAHQARSEAASPDPGEYREIPLRRRGESSSQEDSVAHPTPLSSDRGDTIPLRRRSGNRERS
jgi:hypothetical protein